MKSNRKTKTIILFILGILLAFFPIITNNPKLSTRYHDIIPNYNEENLKVSAISGKIHIDDNWTDARDAGICTGNGTYSEPYIIEDLEIDAGGSGHCIFIENTDEYFKIENCTLSNSGDQEAGIRLYKVRNANITNNTCSNNHLGIQLNVYIYNITISNNIIKDNSQGISHFYCEDTYYSNNKFVNNGIYLNSWANTTLTGNLFYNGGISFFGPKSFIASHRIDTSNLVNGKPIYYYCNQEDLKPENFTDAGQIILVNCNNSKIVNSTISHCDVGIILLYSNNTSIVNCTLNNNNAGISLRYSDNNNLSYNHGTNRYTGIYLDHGENNIVLGNYFSNHSYTGLELYYGYNNNITENTFAESNERGVNIYYSVNNTISNNYILNSKEGGLHLIDSSNISVFNNTISNRDYHFYSDGISLDSSSNNSIIGNNISNHRYGIYLQNSNNSEIIGNSLLDSFEQCIYEEICEGTIIKRNLCNTAIEIKDPFLNDLFGHSPPSYNIKVNLPYAKDLMWYSLDGGLTNIASSDNGTIDKSEWDKKGSGNITLLFYANDTMDNRDFAEVNIRKDITKPIINIITPTENQTFFDDPPFFNIQIIEENLLVQKWYSLNGEINITITSQTQIEPAEWFFLDEGPVVIIFYAMDEIGNVGMSSVIVIKESETGPGVPTVAGYNLFLLFSILSIVTILIVYKVKKS